MGEDQDKCGFVQALLYLFGWGSLSLPNVQWLASLAIAADPSHPDLTALAGIGANGQYPNNMRRDLLNIFCKDDIIPEPVQVRCHNSRGKQKKYTHLQYLALIEVNIA